MAYFWVAAVFFGGSSIVRLVTYFIKPGLVSGYEVLVSLVSFPVLVALWGFIHGQPYLWPWIWQILFVFVAFENLRFFFTQKFREVVEKVGAVKACVAFGAVGIFSLPMLAALAIYAFEFHGFFTWS